MVYSYIDCVFGPNPIIIDDDFWIRTIKHPLIGRLQNIKQLGNSNFVYPSARQTRYAHSLGTGYLISQILSKEIDKGDRQKAIFAGLCHDLGHGPFSHAFEHIILPKLGINEWKHEEMSTILAEKIYESLNEPLFDFKGLGNIFQEGQIDEKNDIFQLISSKTIGFDADRYDYIQRDAIFAGISLTVNWEKLTKGFSFYPDTMGKKYCQVLSRDCIPELSKFLETRYQLFENLYYNTKTKGIELLVADLFLQANQFSNFSEKIKDKEYFVTCDDSILSRISKYKKKSDKFKCLYERFERQDFYDLVGSFNLDTTAFQKLGNSECYKHIHQIKKDISDILIPKIGENAFEIMIVEIDSHKDVHLDKTFVENLNESITILADDPSLTKHFAQKKSLNLFIYGKSSFDINLVSEAINKSTKHIII